VTNRIVIAGTDTDVGKTVFAAALTNALNAYYWKPIQAGLDDGTDTDRVRALTTLTNNRFVPEVYRLNTPASPHYAAEIDGIKIDIAKLDPSELPTPLVIETAGGLHVPLTRETLQIEVIAGWRLPVVLVTSTRLGTINHSLLSIETLRNRDIPIIGIAFIGAENTDSQRTICDFGNVRMLGHLPKLETLNAKTLSKAFADNFNLDDFALPGTAA
jgi:dethiobiotin synthetase